MKTYVALFLFITCSLNANAQPKVIGVIRDLESNEPVAFATINFKGNSFSADEKGNFLIDIDVPLKKTDSIRVSCVGYVTKILALFENRKNDSLAVKLSKAIYVLEEVKVGLHNSEQNIVDVNKFIENFANSFAKNFGTLPYDCKLLYREFSLQDNLYVDFVEAYGLKHFEGVSRKIYGTKLDVFTLCKFDQIRGVNSRLLTSANAGYHPIFWQIAADYMEQNLYRYILLNRTNGIEFKLVEIIDNGNQKVYAISFSPNKKGWGFSYTPYDFIKGSSGLIYINSADYSIVKVSFNHLNINKKIRLKASRYKNELLGLSGNINYTISDGKSVPSYIDFTSFFKDLGTNKEISKKMQYFFSDFNFENQDTKALAERYKTTITKEFPYRGMTLADGYKFYGNPIFNPSFWQKFNTYPNFWDFDKVRSDFKKQNLVLEDELKKFTNKIIDN